MDLYSMKLPKAIKRQIRNSFAGVYVAGILYWISRLFLRHSGEFGEEPHVLEKLSGPIHLTAGLFFLFTVGIIWSRHIQPNLKEKCHCKSGWLLLGFIGLLALSGVFNIYGNLQLIQKMELVHPIIGASLLPLLVFHWKRAGLERDGQR